MSNTIHKTTVIDMIERDVENKYGGIKQNAISFLASMSTSIPMLKAFMPTMTQWLKGKENQYLPKVQSLVNLCVEASFADPEITVEDAYVKSKQLFNESIDELIQQHSQFNLKFIDEGLQLLIGSKLSL